MDFNSLDSTHNISNHTVSSNYRRDWSKDILLCSGISGNVDLSFSYLGSDERHDKKKESCMQVIYINKTVLKAAIEHVILEAEAKFNLDQETKAAKIREMFTDKDSHEILAAYESLSKDCNFKLPVPVDKQIYRDLRFIESLCGKDGDETSVVLSIDLGSYSELARIFKRYIVDTK